MEILEPVRMIVPEDIFLHHTALRYARAYDRRCRHKGFIIIALQPSGRLPYYTISGKLYYKLSDVEQFIRESFNNKWQKQGASE
ncbi:hypothetical protein [Flavobacterium coralii]|uniref:hypothetical protein n=1 Tax=Flavobacterium coralii TaxID=2838017 RepID=UPI0032B20384